MPKKNTPNAAPITPEALAALAASEDDFGHEMRVGGIIRQVLRDHPEHGGTYIDTSTQKPRQFDFRCSLHRIRGHDTRRFKLWLAIECKNVSAETPVIICESARVLNEAWQDFVQSELPSLMPHRVRTRSQLYRCGDPVGKSVLCTKLNDAGSLIKAKDAELYERWSQALSSSHDLILRALNDATGGLQAWTLAVLPAVVLPNDRLWRLQYNDEGQPITVPAQADEATLYVNHVFRANASNPFVGISHIHFFTLGGFERFLRQMTDQDGSDWERFFDI